MSEHGGSVIRGTSFGFLAKRGYFASDHALAQPACMARLGIQWVAINVTVIQPNAFSTRMYQDFEYTPEDRELVALIERFHSQGIRVMLKPMIECLDGAWRGMIRFPDARGMIEGRVTEYWAPWFESLTQSLVHYGRMTQELDCAALCLGCELNGAEPQSAHWQRVIEQVRQVYRGSLTFDTTLMARKEYDTEWFKDLDHIEISFYGRAADRPGATADEMAAFLGPRVQEMSRLAGGVGKPLVFGECGCRSRAGAAMEPADFRKPGTYSGQEQANYLDAVLQSFWDQPWWGGMFHWKWDEQQARPQYRDDPAGDKGFTIAGKPAEQVLHKWYTRSDRS